MQLNRQDVFMTRANQVCGNWQRKAVISRIQSQRLGRLYPAKLKGFRHEFESMDSVHDGELAKHLVAAHHAGARPTWTGTRPLSPTALAARGGSSFVTAPRTGQQW